MAEAIHLCALRHVGRCPMCSSLHSSPQAVAIVLLVPPVNLALLALRRGAAAARLAAVALGAAAAARPAGPCPACCWPRWSAGWDAPPPGGAARRIVILGGDVAEVGPTGRGRARPRARRLGRHRNRDVGPLTLQRLRAGAALSRATRLPVLVTGGPLRARATAGGDADGAQPVAGFRHRRALDRAGGTRHLGERAPQRRDAAA